MLGFFYFEHKKIQIRNFCFSCLHGIPEQNLHMLLMEIYYQTRKSYKLKFKEVLIAQMNIYIRPNHLLTPILHEVNASIINF